jgi:hypothetical protein
MKSPLVRCPVDQGSPKKSLVAAASGLIIDLREFIFTHKFTGKALSKFLVMCLGYAAVI